MLVSRRVPVWVPKKTRVFVISVLKLELQIFASLKPDQREWYELDHQRFSEIEKSFPKKNEPFWIGDANLN